MPDRWTMREARDHLSEVVNLAIKRGLQTITRRGKDAVVLLSLADFEAFRGRQVPLGEFFRRSPLVGVDLHLRRLKDPPRPPPDLR